MSWRDKAKAVLGAGDNRDSRDDSPPLGPNVPNVPSVVSLNPARVLRTWHGRLSKLDLAAVPVGFTPGSWADLCDDAWWLYEAHASVAVRQGWGAQGLWGVRVGYPIGGGLAQFLRTSRKVMFSDGAAFVSLFGVTSRRTPAMGHGLPLIWELR